MAERVAKPTPDTSAADSAAEDLSVLFPDCEISIAGTTIVLTEYPFITELKLKAEHAAFFKSMTDLLGDNTADIEVDDIVEFFEDHFVDVKKLIIASMKTPVELTWEKISPAEMSELMLTWWSVNKSFFLKNIHRIVRKRQKNQCAMPTSTSP